MNLGDVDMGQSKDPTPPDSSEKPEESGEPQSGFKELEAQALWEGRSLVLTAMCKLKRSPKEELSSRRRAQDLSRRALAHLERNTVKTVRATDQKGKGGDPSPTLSAIMCDGMGWFSEIDYKRMLLTYDKIYYLLPQNWVEFEDISGAKQFLHFPIVFQDNPSYEIHYFTPDDKLRELILTAAQIDLTNSELLQVIEAIPKHERIYTWRVVNSDGDLGAGHSIGLAPDQDKLAHAILLNKFLLAADALRCIPITGKPYIHGLISEKYRFGVESVHSNQPELLPSSLQLGHIRHNPVITRIISALVPDEELEKHTEVEIIEFRERNRALFEKYSYSTRNLIGKVSALPLTPDFSSEVEDLINTEVWKEKVEIEKELRSAWEGFFKSAIKSAVGGLVAVGIAPFLSLGAITLATVATATTAITPWAVSALIEFIEARKKAKEHGLYYLMKFAE
jgi:hypothetical protein